MTDTADAAPVGIIGVGPMGLAATEKLIAAGYAVRGYRRGNLDSFAALGGTPMPGAAETAARAQPLILLVPTAAALTEVMYQIDASLTPGQVILCLATLPVEDKRRAAMAAVTAGATLLDGEISGTAGMLRAGQASLMIAGDHAGFETVQPVLAALAPSVTYLPRFGDAVKMKLITNYLVGAHTLAAAEALRFGERLGLDVAQLQSALAASAGGSRMLAVRGPMMVERRYPPSDVAGFLRYFEMLRDALGDGGETPLLDLTDSLYRRAIERGQGLFDIAAIYESLGVAGPPDGDRS